MDGAAAGAGAGRRRHGQRDRAPSRSSRHGRSRRAGRRRRRRRRSRARPAQRPASRRSAPPAAWGRWSRSAASRTGAQGLRRFGDAPARFAGGRRLRRLGFSRTRPAHGAQLGRRAPRAGGRRARKRRHRDGRRRCTVAPRHSDGTVHSRRWHGGRCAGGRSAERLRRLGMRAPARRWALGAPTSVRGPARRRGRPLAGRAGRVADELSGGASSTRGAPSASVRGRARRGRSFARSQALPPSVRRGESGERDLGARLLRLAERRRRRPACGRRRDHRDGEASHPRARAPRLPLAAGDHSRAPQSRSVSLQARPSRSAQSAVS